MARLYRPAIPLAIKCRVAMGQLGEMWPDRVLEEWQGSPGKGAGRLLAKLLATLAELLGCQPADLRLDHNPPLGARPQFRQGLGRTRYVPEANDPEHLFYRPHGPQFAASHLIKTNVRGDHGQHPDRVLIKKARRLAKGPSKKPKRKWQSRPFPKGKQKIPSRPFPKKKPDSRRAK